MTARVENIRELVTLRRSGVRRRSFPPVDTKDVYAVQQLAETVFRRLHPRARLAWLQRLFVDVERLFLGRHPDYSAIDVMYHDLEHTLQATLCTILIMEGRMDAGATPTLTSRHFELAVAAALLHDTGYLKLRSDRLGTGAKYTFCHVIRSTAFAAAYLPTLGATKPEIRAVLSAINCTGPANEINRLDFGSSAEHVIACVLPTADYLGQMAAADYPDELGILFAEFQESDDFIRCPAERRMFKSAEDLAARTPAFWEKFVRPKLETDYQSIYRFLARPAPHGENAYMAAVEANISEIRRRLTATGPYSFVPNVSPLKTTSTTAVTIRR